MVLIKGSNEKTLLARIANGDQLAFQLIFDHYWKTVYGVAMAFTKSDLISEEIAQDVFVRIWSIREKLPEIDKFADYLFIVARNCILNELRKKTREEPFSEFLLQYARANEPCPDSLLSGKQSEELVNKAVLQLPVQQRRVYQLSREGGLSHDAIANLLNISKKTVRSHIYQALNFIRAYLLKHSAILIPFFFFFC